MWDPLSELVATCGVDDTLSRIWGCVEGIWQPVCLLTHTHIPISLDWSPVIGKFCIHFHLSCNRNAQCLSGLFGLLYKLDLVILLRLCLINILYELYSLFYGFIIDFNRHSRQVLKFLFLQKSQTGSVN